MTEEVSTKKFLVGLGLLAVTGAFIGVAVATDLDRRLLLTGWAIIFGALYAFGRWQR